MQTKLQFQQNAPVLDADDHPVGRVDRVVLNPETKVISHLVVRTGSLFNRDEKVLPIDMVADAGQDQVILHDDVNELQALPSLEQKRYVAREQEFPAETSVGAQPLLYGSPMSGAATSPETAGEQFIARTELNIPEGTVAMKEGARVISIEGRRVGHVERVLANTPGDQATHLLVSSGLFARDRKLIPISLVMIMGEDEVHLRVKKDSLEALASV